MDTNRHEHFRVNYCLYASLFVSRRYYQWLLAHFCCDLADCCGIDEANNISGKPGATATVLGPLGDRLLTVDLWPAIAVSAGSADHSTCDSDRIGGRGRVHRWSGVCALGQSCSRAQLERCGNVERRTRTR